MIDNLILLLENPIALLDLALAGLMVGALFAMIAYGMALVWGVMNIINICQGEFVILGGFVAFYFAKWGVTPLVGVPVGAILLFLIGGGLYGGAIYRTLFRTRLTGWATLLGLWIAGIVVHLALGLGLAKLNDAAAPTTFLRVLEVVINGFFFAAPVMLMVGGGIYKIVISRIVDRDLFTSILATFGISIVLQQVMNEAFGADVEVARAKLGSWTFLDGGITIEQIKFVALVGGLLIGAILVVYMRRSRTGQAIRATAQNARAARIMGIDTDAIYARTYALNAAICGAAGALVAMIWAIHPYVGLVYTVRAFMIVILAGLGNLVGVVTAGLGLGAIENVAGFVFGLEFQLAFVFGLLVVVLMVRAVLLHFQRRYLK